MQSFKDTSGREFLISINPLVVERVKAKTGFDLMAIFDPAEIAKISARPVLLVEVIHELVKTQLTCSLDDWANDWDSDTVNAATLALMKAVVDFFPKEARASLAKAIDRVSQVVTGVRTTAIAEFDAKLETEIDKLTGSLSATASAESSESTPAA